MSNYPLVRLTGPSGVGKSTLAAKLLQALPGAQVLISVTTRRPRSGEVHGVDYHFVHADRFRCLNNTGQLAQVVKFGEHWYGTYNWEVTQKLALGPAVVVVEPSSIAQFKRFARVYSTSTKVVSIYLEPPELEETYSRMKARGASDAEIATRREVDATLILPFRHQADYVLTAVSEDQTLQDTLKLLASLLSVDSQAA